MIRVEEIRARLKELHLERATEIPGVVTVLIGAAGFEETTDGNLFLKFADDAFYQAKRFSRGPRCHLPVPPAKAGMRWPPRRPLSLNPNFKGAPSPDPANRTDRRNMSGI